jgi:membrane-bound lytic murein transglycosylase B
MTIIANPNLTEQQVKTILAQTCEKVGGYSYTTNANYTAGSWSTELGYGRVNMNDAVLAAISTSNVAPDISISSYSVNDNTANVDKSSPFRQHKASTSLLLLQPIINWNLGGQVIKYGQQLTH